MKICSKCILPETFPGIKFNDRGVCNHCLLEEAALKKASEAKEEYRKRLDELMGSIKGRAPSYDAIMAYSGGKDSSYTLKLLKERYQLRIVALTFDNHFLSSVSLENIRKVTNFLDIDHLRFTLPWPLMKSIFAMTARKDIFPPPTLLRASSICTACIGLVKSVVLKTAIEMSIPLVAFGWSPGQAPIQSAIMKTNPGLTRQNQLAFQKAFTAEIRERIDPCLVPDVYYEKGRDRFPHNVHPLAFFDYHEEKIKLELNELGWQAPADTDTNSTNCLLNAFANESHLQRHGFHPYVLEIANMVRQGIMSRDEGMKKIYTEQNRERVEYAESRLFS